MGKPPILTQAKVEKFFKKLLGHTNNIEPYNGTVYLSWSQNWKLVDGEIRYHILLSPGPHIKLYCYHDGSFDITYYDYETLEYDSVYTAWAERQKLYP